MDALLVMVKADGSRRRFALSSGVTTVGRKNTCGLRIPLTSVSRLHCEVRVEDGSVSVRDLGSSNGTFKNGKRIQDAGMLAGDELEVGPVRFTLVVDGEPASALGVGAGGAGAGAVDVDGGAELGGAGGEGAVSEMSGVGAGAIDFGSESDASGSGLPLVDAADDEPDVEVDAGVDAELEPEADVQVGLEPEAEPAGGGVTVDPGGDLVGDLDDDDELAAAMSSVDEESAGESVDVIEFDLSSDDDDPDASSEFSFSLDDSDAGGEPEDDGPVIEFLEDDDPVK